MSYPVSDRDASGFIRRQIAAGFDAPAIIAGRAAQLYGAAPERLATLVEAAVAARADELARWPAETDCDRLDRAFAALEASGMLVGQHTGCCDDCGRSDMRARVSREREQGSAIDGYAFYHWQDTDRAVDGGGLLVRYEAAAPNAAIGARVVETLRGEGFRVTWSDESEVAISIPAFDWKRRAPPGAEWTDESVLDRWCREIERATAADFAAALGEPYGEAAVAAGCTSAALAWARAARIEWRSHYPRARALLCVARATGARDVWVEAYASASYGRNGALVELLIAGELVDDTICAAAYECVLQARRDLCGTAELVWYLVRTPYAPFDAEIAVIQRLLEESAARDPDGLLYSGERAAVCAALWMLHHRRGDRDAASAARAEMLEAVAKATALHQPPLARRAAIAAAAELGELREVAPEVIDDVLIDDARRELVDALVRAGHIDTAVEVVAQTFNPARLLVRLARCAPGDPRAAGWIEQAAAAEREYAELYEEGLSPETAPYCDFAALWAEQGELARARRALADVAATRREAVIAIGAAILAQLRDVRDGRASPDDARWIAPDDARWISPDGERKLASALASWRAKVAQGTSRDAQRSAAKVLGAAAALARGGELDRARSLVAEVASAATAPSYVIDGPWIAASIAIGEFDRARAYARELDRPLTTDGAAVLAVALAARGRTTEALARLGTAVERARERAEFFLLVPAVLAVAADPLAAVAAMLDANERAIAALDAMIVEPARD